MNNYKSTFINFYSYYFQTTNTVDLLIVVKAYIEAATIF